IAGCSRLIDAPDTANAMRAWAFSGRASVSADPERAMADVDSSINLDPNSSSSYFIRGQFWTLRNDYDRALADYAKGLRLDPKNVYALNSRAWLWQAQGNFDK